MKTLVYTEKSISYDGTPLSPHWIYRTFDILDDALVAFSGAADVPLTHMVDLEDVKQKAPIYSPAMLHFVGEWFQDNFEVGILLQHLLVAEVYEILLETRGSDGWRRRGNDVYYQNRKLSVSICTKTPVSTLIHLGVNIEIAGTPVPTAGLAELKIEPFDFATRVLERFSEDFRVWRRARVKVLPR